MGVEGHACQQLAFEVRLCELTCLLCGDAHVRCLDGNQKAWLH